MMKANFWYQLTNCHADNRSSDMMLSDYIDILCQDLMLLLSSKRVIEEDNLLGYGLMDLTRLNPQSEQDKRYIQLQIQKTLERYEPRLNNIIVLSVDADPLLPQQMIFHIKANLLMPQGTQQITFDSVIETPTGTIDIHPTKENSHEQ